MDYVELKMAMLYVCVRRTQVLQKREQPCVHFELLFYKND